MLGLAIYNANINDVHDSDQTVLPAKTSVSMHVVKYLHYISITFFRRYHKDHHKGSVHFMWQMQFYQETETDSHSCEQNNTQRVYSEYKYDK